MKELSQPAANKSGKERVMKRIAILFSGQGSQYVGMGRKVYESDESVRGLFDLASDVLGMDMKFGCMGSNHWGSLPVP